MQPILADEVQTFKALITVHKVLQEGHPIVRAEPHLLYGILIIATHFLAQTIKEAHGQTGWLETCARTVGTDGNRGMQFTVLNGVSSNVLSGYGSLIRTYVQFILAKLRFHRLRPEFNGLFEYEEYISLKGIDDPNEG